MGSTTLRIPKAAVSMQEGMLTAWLVPDGGMVAEGQAIYAIELEKSTMDVEAPAAGILHQVGTAGTMYKVGDVIGEIRSADAAIPEQPPSTIAPGDIYHTGYVVADIKSAMHHWVQHAGVGPFALFDNLEFVQPVYRNQAVALRVNVAFAFSGDTCIELIEAPAQTPNIYAETKGALHHIGIGVADLEAGVRTYTGAGVECVFRAGFPFGGGCAYLDTLASLGVFTELVEMNSTVSAMLDQIRVAHRNWNRRDPTFVIS